MLISWKGAFKAKYSSNSSLICLALKFLVMLGGVAFNNLGGVRSLGPPCGFCMLAHPNRTNTTKKRKNLLGKNTPLLFCHILSDIIDFYIFMKITIRN